MARAQRRRRSAARSRTARSAPCDTDLARRRCRCSPALGLVRLRCRSRLMAAWRVVSDITSRDHRRRTSPSSAPPTMPNASTRSVARLLSRPLSAEAAVQVALLNNKGLQATYNELALTEAELVAGQPAAQSDLLAVAHRGRWRQRSRAAGRRRHPRARDACRSVPRSRATAFARRSSRRRWRRCGSPPTCAAPISARSPRNELVGAAGRGAIDGRGHGAAGAEARRDRLAQQARPGPRAGLLCRDHGRARDRAPGGLQRARDGWRG